MFFQKLKRQYFTWCLFVCGIAISHIIENVRAFDPLGLMVNAFMMFALAFLFYCITYCVCAVLSLLGINLPKFLSLLLIALVLFSVIPVSNTEANAKQAAKEGAKKVFIFVAGVVIGDAADDVWDAAEEWVEDTAYDAVYGTAEDVWDFIVSDNTPDCDECKAGCPSCPEDGEWDGHGYSSEYSVTCGSCGERRSTRDYNEYMEWQDNSYCDNCRYIYGH